MDKKILDIIFADYDSYFESEKKIADYIIKNKERVVEMTVAELAKASNTSDASVSRFCRRCGLKGFHHLRISLAKELTESDAKRSISNSIRCDSLNESLENYLANKIEEMSQTIHMLDTDNLQKILELFRKAGCVQFAAVGNTIPVALDGAYKFNQLGIKSVALSIWETQMGFSMNLDRNDIAVIISNTGASKHLIALAQIAKQKGAIVIGITNSENSAIAALSDYHIITATREKLFMDEYCFSRISSMAIIELFYLFLSVSDEHKAEAIRNHEEAIVDDKI